MSDGFDSTTRQRKSVSGLTTNGGVSSVSSTDAVTHDSYRQARLKDCRDRQSLVLWKRPVLTLQYFISEVFHLFHNYGIRLLHHKRHVFGLILVIFSGVIAYHVEGSHQKYVSLIQKKILWCAYWVGLGVLSSVGLGTGLHTFLLYLGPHIAAVTLAAHECGSLKFPEPPYPDEIICPDESPGTSKSIGILSIMSKVRLEAFMWGAGTALGELPPYFMAKAARLSGNDSEDLEVLEELRQKTESATELSFLDKAKLAVEKLVEKVGFFGILACASIPNPLFDLAGITCGHFLVPFWTFFGATLIGKAIIKMHIQKLFVIIAFNEHHVELVVRTLTFIPYVGKYLQAPFKEFLAKQKAKLHRKVGAHVSQEQEREGSLLAWIFEKFVMAMIVYFVLSIVNSMAQSYHKRLSKEQHGGKISNKKVAIS